MKNSTDEYELTEEYRRKAHRNLIKYLRERGLREDNQKTLDFQ